MPQKAYCHEAYQPNWVIQLLAHFMKGRYSEGGKSWAASNWVIQSGWRLGTDGAGTCHCVPLGPARTRNLGALAFFSQSVSKVDLVHRCARLAHTVASHLVTIADVLHGCSTRGSTCEVWAVVVRTDAGSSKGLVTLGKVLAPIFPCAHVRHLVSSSVLDKRNSRS